MTELVFPRTREAPAEVMAGLRAVRPDVDLLWWGLYGFAARDQQNKPVTVDRPAWLLVVPGIEQALRANAAAALDLWAKAPVDRQHPQKIKLALLRYRGWKPIAAIPTRDADWGIVDDFAAWDWAVRFGNRAYDAIPLDEEDQLEERQKQIMEAVQGTMKDIWRHVWGGRRSVLLNANN